MRGEAKLASAWADTCNQNIETERFRVRLRFDWNETACMPAFPPRHPNKMWNPFCWEKSFVSFTVILLCVPFWKPSMFQVCPQLGNMFSTLQVLHGLLAVNFGVQIHITHVPQTDALLWGKGFPLSPVTHFNSVFHWNSLMEHLSTVMALVRVSPLLKLLHWTRILCRL